MDGAAALSIIVPTTGLEPATFSLGERRAFQLRHMGISIIAYRLLLETPANIRNEATSTGLEPATSSSTERRSTTELRSHASTIRLSITVNNFIIATETIIQQNPPMQNHRRVVLPSGNATATPTGFEPATSAVTGRHSNQAELRSHKHNTLLLSKFNATDEVHLISATKIQYSALTRQFKSSACRVEPCFQIIRRIDLFIQSTIINHIDDMLNIRVRQ